ncbi:MAG: glycosyltransferase family 4 protein [Gemmatimonadaceae bacterium]
MTRVMRVLHVSAGNLYGGIETMLVTLARYHDACPEMEPHFALAFEGRVSAELRESGASVHVLGVVRASRPASVWRARRALRAVLRREGFDVVICHAPWAQAVFGPAARTMGVPLVFWMHGAANGRHWLEQWAGRTRPDVVIATSRYAASTAPNLYPGVRSEVLYPPVAPPVRDGGVRTAVRGEFGTPARAVVIIQVSRMESWKGHAAHLNALHDLAGVPDWMCWLVGGAQRPAEVRYVEQLRASAAQYGIGERVRFLGQRSDVSRLLAAADIQCQPNSSPEPFGIAFVEALYCGLPVVATALGGPTEIVDDSCGVLVPHDEAGALARALRRLIEDSALRARLAAGGPERARLLCDPAMQMRRLARLCTSLC